MAPSKKRALLYHLDLGIGGAERLVISLALALADAEWDVTIATTRFDPTRSFPECQDERIRILKSGSWIPRSCFSILTALFSIIRLIWLYCYLLMISINERSYDVIVNDQLAMLNPLLKQLGPKVVFYCHFPDPLMASRDKLLSCSYRRVLDVLEVKGMNHADLVWVNSEFTRKKFEAVFEKKVHDRVEVLYPCVPLDLNDTERTLPQSLITKRFFLSLNRFEFKKNHQLAIEAFIQFSTESSFKDKEYKLVICGGYDATLPENEMCFQFLKKAAEPISEKVLFIRSASDGVRSALLKNATAVLYTPSDEHFGIVPIESMSYGTPVIAVNSGGPTESVLEGSTGTLTESTPASFSEAMQKWATYSDSIDVRDRCRARARHFSYEMFSKQVTKRLEA